MTRALEHSTEHKNSLFADQDLSHSPELADMNTGGQIWRGLNAVTEALADAAEQSGAHEIDGLYPVGNLDEMHILAGRETDTVDGHPIQTCRLQVVDPTRGAFFYLGSRVATGDQEIVDIRVHEEDGMGNSRNVVFSGSEQDALSDADIRLTQQLTKTLLDVANIQHDQGEISDDTLLDITEPLVIPEMAHSQSKKRFGQAVVNRVVSWLDRHRTAA